MDQDRRGQWLRGVLDVCVLALLSHRESYGYELAQAFDEAGMGQIQGGTLYPVLLRLQRTGLVAAEWREGEAGPARKYYRLTPSGEQSMRQLTADWAAFAGRVDAILGGGSQHEQ
ncbi:PadR family transcriptional regulator [Phytohabitans rumicis]|uniref:PadR family transcriptional regulator n=1 Tax=Phytohabitans rumicis TaxID=1076125 RepID=A0A6V8L5G3_9ACTN|nr:PadR family transcriptional regulator [Phytohabitans rumicis]GFJ90248.1 PadR family transcriptional regulator [Phytohabitans rumicis]